MSHPDRQPGIKPAQRPKSRVLGRPLSCHSGGYGEVSGPVPGIHRPAHGSCWGGLPSAAMVCMRLSGNTAPSGALPHCRCTSGKDVAPYGARTPLHQAHAQWVADALRAGDRAREGIWSEHFVHLRHSPSVGLAGSIAPPCCNAAGWVRPTVSAIRRSQPTVGSILKAVVQGRTATGRKRPTADLLGDWLVQRGDAAEG